MGKTIEAAKLAAESLEFTRRIIDECGPRLAGTDACKRSGEIIRKEMGKYCDRTEIDEFDFHPMALLGFIRATTVAYIISSLFLFFGYVIPAALGYTFIVAISLSQFVFYLQLFDPIYKKAKGYNVYGVIEPAGEVKQQIIVSGHHDSAYVFNFFMKFPKLYRIRLILGILPMHLSFFLAWLWLIMQYGFDTAPFFADWFRYGALACIIFVAPLYFFIGKNGTPGAGDNMIATAIALKIAGIFGKAGRKKKSALRHTRLIIVSFDAEESGLRGARAFAKRHRAEFQALPTYCFNMDSIYDLDKIKFLVRDINGFQGLSRKMARKCTGIASRLGYRTKPLVLPFGGGGTDAAELAKVGVEATTLLAMPVSVERDAVVYHTSQDTVDHIQPEAVEAIFRILHEYILEMDSEA